MPLVQIEDRGAVRHVVLARSEKRNALSGEVVQALGDAFRGAANDDTVRCVVVRGEGAMFSSGMDLADLRALSENPRGLRSYRREILAIWNLLEEMPKPTICQIHGACLGGAMELALACDMRVMAEDAVCGLLETRIGLLPDVGGCSRLPAVVGLGRAKELIMTGKVIDGREAHRIGFANRIAPLDGLDHATSLLCEELLACAPLAIGPRSASLTHRRAPRWPRRWSRRSPRRRCSRRPRTSPRAPARSRRSATPSSPAAEGRPLRGRPAGAQPRPRRRSRRGRSRSRPRGYRRPLLRGGG